MSKRGESGLSLLVAVDKPRGMSSHDVVNRARRILGERRVGHTGTLDPLATGVLPLCIGPATRLDQYMTGHDKSYRVTIAFGFETTTDDAEGMPTASGLARAELADEGFARDFLHSFIGAHEQIPPQYSAVKVNGKRAYMIARSGGKAALDARPIEVYVAELAALFIDGRTGLTCWEVDFSVSKGTYIRALARDIGRSVGCPAHVSALQRRQAGAIMLDDCVSLESLEARGTDAAIDPVAVLGYRFAFGDDASRTIDSGGRLRAPDLALNEPLALRADESICACTSSVIASDAPPVNGELISVVVENRLKALYEFVAGSDTWKPACVFSTGVARA